MGSSGGQSAPADYTRYACAPGDEVCKRNYRKHNFAIQSYPSYEQTLIESPAGAIQEIKVAVVLEKDNLELSVNQLKAGIAAAADPSLSPDDVEIVFRPPLASNTKDGKNKVFLFGSSPEGGGFPWWWIMIGLIACIFVFPLFRSLVGLFVGQPKTFRDRVPFPSPSPNLTPSNSPFNVMQPQAPPQATTPPPASTQPPPPSPAPPRQIDDEFEVETPSYRAQNETKTSNNLPFDLDDELADRPVTQPTTNRQPNIRPQRQRPTVIIEDDNNLQ